MLVTMSWFAFILKEFQKRFQKKLYAGTEHFSYNLYTCKIPFIHLLGSSLVQWVMVRINIKEETKPDLQVRLGEASLCLGGALLCLGGLEKCISLGSA